MSDHRDLCDVWCGNDQLATIDDYWFQFVKPLAAVQMSSYFVGMIDSTRRTG
jgi:hypothetical protein